VNAEGKEHANPNSGRRPSLSLRITIVFLAAVLVWLLVVEGFDPFFGSAYWDRVGHAVRAVLTSALAVPLVALARRYLDCRPWGGLRLTSLRLGWRPLLWGMVFWLVAAGVGLATTLVLGWASVSFAAPGPRALLLFTYQPLLVFLYEAFRRSSSSGVTFTGNPQTSTRAGSRWWRRQPASLSGAQPSAWRVRWTGSSS
jgi:hypothetical protein